MYHILETQPYRFVVHIIYAGDGGFGLDFLQGHLIAPPTDPDQLFVMVEAKRFDLPDYFEAGCVPIVTDKVLHALRATGVDNYQAFPVQVRFENGTVSGYYVLNVIGRMSCIDEERSDTTGEDGFIMRLKRLVFQEGFASYDLDMFRSDEYQDVVFISDRVRKAIEDAGISGALINPADGWSDAHRF